MDEAKLIYSATMSLDGFIAGPGGDMSWLTKHLGAADPVAQSLLENIGALLVGANTFGGDDPNAGTDKEGAFGGQWSGPSVVLTHDAGRSSPDPNTTFAGDLESAVAAAKEAAGRQYVNVLGADVARQCIEAGLLDEILVFIAPVLLGDGVSLFARPSGPEVDLEPVEVENPGGARPSGTG